MRAGSLKIFVLNLSLWHLPQQSIHNPSMYLEFRFTRLFPFLTLQCYRHSKSLTNEVKLAFTEHLLCAKHFSKGFIKKIYIILTQAYKYFYIS